jgi:hypothetical protein
VTANRQNREIRFIESTDEAHIAKDARVSGKVDRSAARAKYEATCRPAKTAIGRAPRMASVRLSNADRAAHIGAETIIAFQALSFELTSQILRRNNRRMKIVPKPHGLAHMIKVTVRKDNEIDATRRGFSRGTVSVFQPRINVDLKAVGQRETKGRGSKPS